LAAEDRLLYTIRDHHPLTATWRRVTDLEQKGLRFAMEQVYKTGTPCHLIHMLEFRHSELDCEAIIEPCQYHLQISTSKTKHTVRSESILTRHLGSLQDR
jgi:hypothetical protein